LKVIVHKEYCEARVNALEQALVVSACSYTNKSISYQLMRASKAPDYPGKEKRIEELRSKKIVHMARTQDGVVTFPVGLLSHVLSKVPAESVQMVFHPYEAVEGRRRILDGVRPRYLRKPQQEAFDVLMVTNRELWEKGASIAPWRGTICLPTGVGKTLLAIELIRKMGLRALFLVPSVPILKQSIEKFEQALGKKNVGVWGGGKKSKGYVTIATYQSVYAASAEEFSSVDLVIGDEVHHAPASTFEEVFNERLKNATFKFGLTAEPERADGSTLAVFAAAGDVVYEYSVKQAIEDGYLARPTFMVMDVDQTYGEYKKIVTNKRTKQETEHSIKVNRYDGSDSLEAHCNWLSGNFALDDMVVGLTQDAVAAGQSVLIMVEHLHHGKRLNEKIPGSGYVYGGLSTSEDLCKSFNRRELKVLIGTSTLGEGADLVPVDLLINLQGGVARGAVKQLVGRALRNDEDENGVARKPTTTICDFRFLGCQLLINQLEKRIKIYSEMGEVV